MSFLDNLARARPRREPESRGRQLHVVPTPAESPSRTPFVLLVVLVLSVGLVGLLLLNTTLQQGAFAIHDLARTTTSLEERQGVLEQRVAQLKAPDNLARRAQAIGMVPNTNPVFLRLSDGAVLGSAVPARPRPTPKPKPTAKPPAATPGQPTPGQPTPPAAAVGGQPQNAPSPAGSEPLPGGDQ